MTIASDLTRIKNAKTAIRQAIIDKGVEVPETELISTYSGYIDQISTQVGPDPNDPTLANLKLALSTDNPASIYPVGTEVPDTYDGNPNPLIVAQYLDGSSDAYKDTAGNNAIGVLLVRKYVQPTNQSFSTTNANYSNSTIKSFLDTTYLSNCSDELKELITEISFATDVMSLLRMINGKWFLMSSTEVNGTASGYGGHVEGIAWDYWKEKTGLTTPSNAANNGRLLTSESGTVINTWLRSPGTLNNPEFVGTNGSVIWGNAPSSAYGVLPACFIAKN